MGIAHTPVKHKLHAKTSVEVCVRGPSYLLADGRAAQWSHDLATVCNYDRPGSVVMKKQSDFFQDSLTRQDELGIKWRPNQWLALLTFMFTLVDLLRWTVCSYIAWRMCRQDRQQRQSWLRRRGFHQGFQGQHAVKLHQLILYSNCTCTNMLVGYFHRLCTPYNLPRTQTLILILNLNYKQSGRL